MTKELAKKGFTLIELLVVVLIIGILAAVALPQYQKAVRKARLAEVATTFNALSKGIDMWLLENGCPTSAGVSLRGALDIEICPDGNCNTKVGYWDYECGRLVGPGGCCRISLDATYNGNTWLDNSAIEWYQNANGQWGMLADHVAPSALPEVCRWWRDLYGADRIFTSGGTVSMACNAYL